MGKSIRGSHHRQHGQAFWNRLDRGSGHLSRRSYFRLDPPANEGDPWTESVLHSFGGPDGFRSWHVGWRSGSLYGTTSAGGLNGTGTVFVLTP